MGSGVSVTGKEYYLGIDLGGTNIVVGLVDDTGHILVKESIKTKAPRSPESICDDIAVLCKKILAGKGLSPQTVKWAGLGSPGVIHNNVIVYASNLEFHDVPLGKILEERLGIPVHLENDANAAAYGELMAGVGVGYRSLIMLTIGTGIGGGIVADEKIWSGFNGAAGELGHIVVHSGGKVCSCGKVGCLEAYCSANALKKATRKAMEQDKDSVMWQLVGGDLSRISAKTAFDAMRQEDDTGKKLVDEYIFYLSLGVSNAINLFQPEIFCLGGGVSREGETILVPLRKLVIEQTYLKKDEQRPRIVSAMLGGDAGLIGAAMLGKQSAV